MRSELEEKLTLKLGNLGEMFGVVKQVSGQTRGEFKNSITNIDNPDRDLFLKNLAESKKLPDLKDISGLWVELVKEIRNAESIKTFNTNVLSADGDNSELEVLRIGTFSITHNGMFLKHLIDTNQIEFLPSQPSGVNKRKLKRLQNNATGSRYAYFTHFQTGSAFRRSSEFTLYPETSELYRINMSKYNQRSGLS